jgi:hypothetical protein
MSASFASPYNDSQQTVALSKTDRNASKILQYVDVKVYKNQICRPHYIGDYIRLSPVLAPEMQVFHPRRSSSPLQRLVALVPRANPRTRLHSR